MCSAHGLPLLALGLPAAGVTTVLVPPATLLDPRAAREAVAAHAATDVVVAAAPDEAAALAAPVPRDGRLSSLRRVVVAAPTPFTPEARQEFRRRLPWVELTELLPGVPVPPNETDLVQVPVDDLPAAADPGGPAVALARHNTLPADRTTATNEADSPVPPLKKIQNIILGDIFSRSTTSKILRKHPVTGNRQAVSKM